MATHIARLPAKQFLSAILLSSSLLLGGISCSAAAQEIAFAFTDTLAPTTGLSGLARARMLVNSLQRIDVAPSMFLIRTADINTETIERLAFYDEAGQLLINAGHNQSSLSRKTLHYSEMDIAKANTILSRYTHYHQHIYLPYLYQDGNRHTLLDLQHYLKAQGYQPSYITYQAQDQYLDQLYQVQLAQGKTANLEALKKAYVNLVLEDITAYSSHALLILGYYPRQVILLHETDLTAYSIVNLADALSEKGFRIISPEKIFSDPVANPFFNAGYSPTGDLQSIGLFAEPQRTRAYIPGPQEKQKIHRHLIAQGLAGLIAD